MFRILQDVGFVDGFLQLLGDDQGIVRGGRGIVRVAAHQNDEFVTAQTGGRVFLTQHHLQTEATWISSSSPI